MDFNKIVEIESQKADVKEIEYIKGNYGKAYIKDKKIRIPKPLTLRTLATALHEIGHIAIGKVKPQYYSEFLAEMFVRQKFKEYGLTLKRAIADRQKSYVAYRVKLSVKRATNPKYKVKSEVLKFINSKQPVIIKKEE